MSTNNRASSPSVDTTRFFLLFAFLFGIAVRIYPLLGRDFPLVDGGMFFTMIGDLQDSRFSLPSFTTYNTADIPFAYPPLALYFTGLVQLITRAPLTWLLQWLPFAINVSVLPLFYLLAKRLLKSDPKAALATLVFALTPNSFWWQIVGGGLTRAPGAVFFLLTAIALERVFSKRTPGWIMASAVSATATVLSHPEWGLQAGSAIILFALFYGRDKQGAAITMGILASVILLTSPWWLTVTGQHGWDIFVQAAQVSNSRWLFWTIPFSLSFSGETAPVIAALGVFGLFIHAARKDVLLPAWALLCLLVDPRGGLPVSVIPFSMLASTTLAGITAQLLPSGHREDMWLDSLGTLAGRAFWGFVILLFTFNAFQVSSSLRSHSISSVERDAFKWVSDNTLPSDRFLILTNASNPLLSPLLEWFPAMTGRHSALTVQGSEWLEGQNSSPH